MSKSIPNVPSSLDSLELENLSVKGLYKFRSWSNDADPHGRDIIENNIMYFASAKSFNDPFEARIPLRYDLCRKEYMFDLFLRHAEWGFPELSKDEYLSLALEYVNQEIYRQPQEIQRWAEDHYIYCSTKYGIVSLTEDYSNIVLWSHYADSHRGYCIGFSARALLEYRHSPIGLEKNYDLFRVSYRNDIPNLIPSELSKSDLSILPLVTKSNDWIYEKEFRLISLDGLGEMDIPDSLISKIIIGYRFSEKNKDELLNLLLRKPYRIPLYSSSLKAHGFGLEFTLLEY